MKKYQLYLNKTSYNFYKNSGEIFTYIFYIDIFFILFILKLYNIIFYIFYIYFIFIYKIYTSGSNIVVIRYINKIYLNFLIFFMKNQIDVARYIFLKIFENMKIIYTIYQYI